MPFRDYINTRGGAGNVISGARLAKDVLAELPDQFIDHMKKRGIKPASWQAQATRWNSAELPLWRHNMADLSLTSQVADISSFFSSFPIGPH